MPKLATITLGKRKWKRHVDINGRTFFAYEIKFKEVSEMDVLYARFVPSYRNISSEFHKIVQMTNDEGKITWFAETKPNTSISIDIFKLATAEVYKL